MKKVLIANRGEIAVRIIRACHDLGIKTVAIYSQADAEALHVLHADEAICVGASAATMSYLRIPNIISACEISGADAIHPGYGFLSENANFASICESCGVTFIGPHSSTISLLGDKAEAKVTARNARCPVIPGSAGIVNDLNKAKDIAKNLGYPIFVKAVAGGGGRGIRIAYSAEELEKQYTAARAEAEINFSNPDVYIEKMIEDPRHVEVQILGDKHGRYIHLGERYCTIQRRRQKLIEESPSPAISEKLRKAICNAAVNVAKEAKYHSAGTVEFLIDKHGKFYFMEMNTRIQVEHSVSEELTGVDILKEQIRIARGEKLQYRQKDISFSGHVMQFRVNAEDPQKNFMPSPGKVEYFVAPGGPHVRVDTACYSGYAITPHYDSMIAKLIVRGKDRDEAMKVARRALREFHIGGVHSTIPFHQYMLEDVNFQGGKQYTLNYVDDIIAEGCDFSMLNDQ